MVLFLEFNLAETTSAWLLLDRGQAQQKPNSMQAPMVETEYEENLVPWRRNQKLYRQAKAERIQQH